MRTTYREKRYQCGDYLDVYIYPVHPCKGRPSGRARKRKPTREVQQKLNKRHASEKLTRLLNTNFTEDDLSLTLTFAENPTEDQEAVRDIQRFLRRMRYRSQRSWQRCRRGARRPRLPVMI